MERQYAVVGPAPADRLAMAGDTGEGDDMTVGGVCSGTGGFSLAFERAGFELAWECEIDAQCRKLLAARFPGVTIYDDMTTFNPPAVDILCGGTPCQGFSVAGLRGSLQDDRSNLCLRFVYIADQLNPGIILWENVPGCLSTDDNAFGCFLAGLVGADAPLVPPAAAGGRWTNAGVVTGPKRTAAWRILDAQYFGLAQRRERVFVVASPRAELPFQILFEPEGVRRHSPPSRETRERVTGTISSRTTGGGGLGTDFDIGGGLIPEIPEVAWALQERDSKGSDSKGSDSSTKEGHLIPCQIASPLTVNAYADRASEENNLIAHSLRGEGFDASEEGTGRGTPLVAIPIDLRNGLSDGDKNYDVTPFDTTQITSKGNYSRPQPGAPCHPLAEGAHPPAIAYRTSDNCNAVEQGDKTAALNTATDPNQNIICFQPRIARNGRGQPDEIAPALNGTNAGDSSDSRPVIATQWGVRRLQPIECEKLQGFPAGHTEGYSDSARYKMIGNAVAVPVVTWLAIRIKAAIAPQPPA